MSEIQGFRLSPQQARLWRRIAAEGVSAYMARCRVEIDGPLDPPALERALARLVERWEILRTGFRTPPGFAEPLQVIEPAARPAFMARGLDQLVPPADLARPPLVAAALAPRGPGKAVLALALPALITDEAGLDLLVRDLVRAYGEERGELTATTETSEGSELLQYADLADWLCDLRESPETEEGRGYWGRQEIPMLAASELPLSLPLASAGETGELAPARCAVELPSGLPVRLAELSRSLRVNLADLLASAWGVLLARLVGRAEVALAVTFAGRKFFELEGAIGQFASRIPVPLDLPGDLGFAAAVEHTAAALAERRGFEEVFAEELLPGGAAPEMPFAFAYLAVPPRVAAAGVTFCVEEREVVADRFLIELRASGGDAPGSLMLELRYDALRLAAADAELLAGRLGALLADAAERPQATLAELTVLGMAEREQLVRGWNDTRRDLGPVRTLHGLFAAQAARTPERTALESEVGDRTYADLDGESDALAAELAARGVGRGDVVALFLERSPRMVVALLAVLKTGAAFLPIEPGHPAERRAWMLADARPALVLLDEEPPADLAGVSSVLDLRTFDSHKGARFALPPLDPDDLAYVIYTSGSSGRPKGVAVTHGAITNRLLWMQAELPVGEGDAILQKTPYGFDASLWEIFVPLATGARLVLARPGAHGDTAYLARVVAERGVTVLQLVPSLLGPFLATEESGACRGILRRLFCGGEALPVELAARSLERLGLAPVNLYGPTEAAIDAACHADCQAAVAAGRAGVVPIGRPIANDRILLFDKRGRLALQGAHGEIAIGGTGLARGYLGRPDLTAERFVPDAWSEEPGERLYRTGDFARRRADGAVEYLGRIDNQVKIRGVRIEMGEIEAALARLPGVVEAAAATHEGPAGDLRLVAYVVPAEGGQFVPGTVRAQLAAWLPEVMVPSDVMALAALPRLPNGKLDRRSLPAPGRGGGRAGYAAPRTPTEQVLAERMAELFGVERIGVLDSFFDLGFHSLLATQLGSRLRRIFGVTVPLRALFELPTVAALAARIDAGLRGDPRLEAPRLVRAPRDPDRGEPLSFAQRRLWFLDQMQPGSPFYNIPIALSLRGLFEKGAFTASVSEIVRRHESLRTTFDEVDSEPVQRIASPIAGGWISEIDLEGLPEAERWAEALRLRRLEALRPFDLGRGPLLRSLLVRLAPEEHLALFTLHHIISDGWSTGLLTRELAALYTAFVAAQPSPLAMPGLQYADYARWQHGWLDGEALVALNDFWRRELGDAPPRLDLPGDRPRPAVATTRGGARTCLLPRELAGDLERLARTESVTLFMVVLAAGAALLGWLAGSDDLVLGTDVAGRDRAETEGIVGFFINQLALRCRLGGDPEFRELIARVRETTLAAYAHQDLPFDKLVEALNPDRSRAFAPVFQAKVNLHNMPAPPLELSGLTITPAAVPRATAQFDWILNLTPHAEGLQAAIEYSADLFDAATIDRMLALLEALLSTVAARPAIRLSELAGQLAAVDAAERERSLGSRQRERHRQLKSVRREAVEAVVPEDRP